MHARGASTGTRAFVTDERQDLLDVDVVDGAVDVGLLRLLRMGPHGFGAEWRLYISLPR